MSLEHVVGLGIVLFAIGAAGFFLRSNTVVLLLCIEVMLNAVNPTAAALTATAAAERGMPAAGPLRSRSMTTNRNSTRTAPM